MIRTIKSRFYDEDLVLVELAGNSGDSKPTAGMVTGSVFHEVDTGKDYYFDEVSGGWAAQNSGNGKTPISGADVVLGSALTYTGSEQTKAISSVKIGQTTLTSGTDYTVSGNKGTEPGNYTMRLVGIGTYAGYKDVAWTIGKGSGGVVASPDELSLEEGGDAGTSTLTVTGDGTDISVATSAADVATASVEDDTVTVTPVGAGSATITVTLAENEHYTGGTDTISVTVAAAEADS